MYIISRQNPFLLLLLPTFFSVSTFAAASPSSPPPLPSILFASQKAKLDFCTILCPVGLAEAEGASLLPLLSLSPPRSPQLYQRPTFQAKCDLVAPSSVARSLARSTADIAAFWWTHKRAQKKVSLRSEGFLLLLGKKKRKKSTTKFYGQKTFEIFFEQGAAKTRGRSNGNFLILFVPPPILLRFLFSVLFTRLFFLLSSVVRSASEILFHAHWSPSSFISGPPPSPLGMMAPKDEGGREGGKGKKGFVHFPPSSSNPPSLLLLFLLLPSPFWCCSHEDDDGGGGPLFLLSPALLSGISSVSAKPRKRIELADGEGGEGRKMGKGLSRMSREEGAEKGGKKRKKERGWGRKRKGFSKKEGESKHGEGGKEPPMPRERGGGRDHQRPRIEEDAAIGRKRKKKRVH